MVSPIANKREAPHKHTTLSSHLKVHSIQLTLLGLGFLGGLESGTSIIILLFRHIVFELSVNTFPDNLFGENLSAKGGRDGSLGNRWSHDNRTSNSEGRKGASGCLLHLGERLGGLGCLC